MSRSASLLARQHVAQEKRALQTSTQLPASSLEDRRLAERVERALHATGYWALRTVRVSVDARVVVLGGRIPSYYLKQCAQATARAVSGAHQIRNDLNVIQPH